MNWDVISKLLLKECAQDFVTCFAPGARFVRMRESQFQTRGDGPYEAREMRGDSIVEAAYEDRPFLLHIEWQSDKDEIMDRRLLGYNFEGMRLHGLDVLSAVIYLQAVSDVPKPPLVRALPFGRQVLWFDFESLELYEQSVETFRRLNLDAFYTLMLLCKDGATFEVLDEVLDRLVTRNRKELISIVRFFAGKVLTSEADRERLERRFAMVRDFLEDSWTYQQTIAEGVERGMEQGLERGMEQGRVQGQRKSIEGVTQLRFPKLLSYVKKQIASLTDEATLQEVLNMVSIAATERELRQSLSALS